MTRLTPEDLINIQEDIHICEQIIYEITDRKIIQLLENIYNIKYNGEKIGIIPITSGNGLIDNFSESLLKILRMFNMDSFITKRVDVSGYYEAIKKNADIILMADDSTFLAYNLKNMKISNNQIATGKIYSEILINSKNLNDKDILIIGAGNVGKPAIENFIKYNYNIYIYDLDESKIDDIIKKFPTIIKYNFNQNKKFSKIFEATPSENTIPESVLINGTIVSTPGIPRALSKTLETKYNIKLIMEPLGLGTLSMIYEIL